MPPPPPPREKSLLGVMSFGEQELRSTVLSVEPQIDFVILFHSGLLADSIPLRLHISLLL